MCVYTYIYIYINHESMYVCMYIYIYMFITKLRFIFPLFPCSPGRPAKFTARGLRSSLLRSGAVQTSWHRHHPGPPAAGRRLAGGSPSGNPGRDAGAVRTPLPRAASRGGAVERCPVVELGDVDFVDILDETCHEALLSCAQYCERPKGLLGSVKGQFT